MELALNLAWVLLGAWMVWRWLRYASARGADRRVQIVALAAVILILLPAISMTDDLMAASNPAEIDTCLRRDHDGVSPHALVPTTAALVVPFFVGPALGTASHLVAADSSAPAPDNPALVSIENRPPPAA